MIPEFIPTSDGVGGVVELNKIFLDCVRSPDYPRYPTKISCGAELWRKLKDVIVTPQFGYFIFGLGQPTTTLQLKIMNVYASKPENNIVTLELNPLMQDGVFYIYF